MRVIYDWRLSRVIDADSNIVDELTWTSSRTSKSVASRLEDLQKGRLSPEARILSSRFPDAIPDAVGHLTHAEWPDMAAEEQQLLESAANILAKRGVAEAAGSIDRRLDMLVSSQSELRSAWTTLEARCIEWVGLLLPSLDLDNDRERIPRAVSDSTSLRDASDRLGTNPPPHSPSEVEWKAIQDIGQRCLDIANSLTSSEEAIRTIASEYLPSLSKLVGPLGAAKLCVLAGGRERLARMPSGSIQVLGAHAAMAAHRRGAPPPKHGSVIFSMPQVSRSPRWVRGKIARFLAGKASIASRLDHFDGDPWTESEIAEIHRLSEGIKQKFPSPPKRK
ncbi:MAG: hypothetical protein VXX59_04635 [Candidatus Thermoplasmatota archaeon]|nr:hypothetical protein [Candidatus Thermoplasmatota archaeon]